MCVLCLCFNFFNDELVAFSISGILLCFISWSIFNKVGALRAQEPVLFAADIHANIGFGTPGASEEEVREAARAANAAIFIERLPEGYHTQVGFLLCS